jgi:hypothetical protein
MITRWLLPCSGALLIARCHAAPVPDAPLQGASLPVSSVALGAPVAPAASSTSGSPRVNFAVPPADHIALAMLADGTLVASTEEWVATRARSTGQIAYRPLAKGDSLNQESAREGLVVSHASGGSERMQRGNCTLLKTPSLEKVMSGRCSVPIRDWGAVVFTDGTPGARPTLAFQKNGTVFKFAVPGTETSFEEIEPSASGQSVVLTPPEAITALLVKTDTGALLGNVPPLSGGGYVSTGAIVGEFLYVLHDDAVERIEMSTGTRMSRTPVGCSRKRASVSSSSTLPAGFTPVPFDVSNDAHSLFVAAQGTRMTVICQGNLLVFGNGKLEGKIRVSSPAATTSVLPP